MAYEKFIDVVLPYLPPLLWAVFIITGAHVIEKFMSLLYINFIKKKIGETYFLKFGVVLIKIAIYFVALLLIIAKIPGLSKDIIQVLGIVVGGIFAFSSSTIIANAMSGILIDFIKPYRVGDMVKIDEHLGVVKKIDIFHTQIETPKNEILTIPNNSVMSKAVVINLSDEHYLIDASVSISYDTPRKVVEKLLLQAAKKTGLQDSFVLVLELQDFSVKYNVRGMILDVSRIIEYRSNLRKNILDEFNKARVEILSPDYIAFRKANVKVVAKSG